MKIIARCHPALDGLLPKPSPASQCLPEWLKAMPSQVASHTLGGETVRTLKHCPPFVDAMTTGLIMPLPADITIESGKVSWDWDMPIIDDAPITRAPVGVHVPEQVDGAPVEAAGRLLVKFNTFWTLEAEPGWSLIFTHPFNRPDLPFTTMTGSVDSDTFTHGYVHFPVLLDPSFEGVILKGTPVAQVLPFRRGDVDLEVSVMTQNDIAKSRETQEALGAQRGVYRKNFRNALKKSVGLAQS